MVKKKELYEKTKTELMIEVKTLKNEMDLIKEDTFKENKEDKGYRLYLGSSETTKRLKKRINFKFAIQGLISIGILCGSLWMISNWRTDILLPGVFLFIFGLVYYNQIMKTHVINTLGACELVIKKEK